MAEQTAYNIDCMEYMKSVPDKYFDPFLGSGTTRLAAYDTKRNFVGCEIDKTYFDLQEQRWQDYTAQGRLF